MLFVVVVSLLSTIELLIYGVLYKLVNVDWSLKQGVADRMHIDCYQIFTSLI